MTVRLIGTISPDQFKALFLSKRTQFEQMLQLNRGPAPTFTALGSAGRALKLSGSEFI